MCSNTIDIPVLSICINSKHLITLKFVLLGFFHNRQYLASMTENFLDSVSIFYVFVYMYCFIFTNKSFLLCPCTFLNKEILFTATVFVFLF